MEYVFVLENQEGFLGVFTSLENAQNYYVRGISGVWMEEEKGKAWFCEITGHRILKVKLDS